MLEFINFFMEIIRKYVALLFSLPIWENVTVGSFWLGCAIFSVIIGYLLSRFLLSPDESEAAGNRAWEAYNDRKTSELYDDLNN